MQLIVILLSNQEHVPPDLRYLKAMIHSTIIKELNIKINSNEFKLPINIKNTYTIDIYTKIKKLKIAILQKLD